MKRIFLSLVLLPLIIACNQDIKDENAKLKAENEELQTALTATDSMNEAINGTIEQVKSNLDSIKLKKGFIESMQSDGFDNDKNQEQALLDDIAAIDALIAQNEASIEKMNDKIQRYSRETGKYKIDIKKYKAQLDLLTSQIEEKNQEIVVLKEDLASKNYKIGELNTRLANVSNLSKAQKAKIAQQEAALNTAYYSVGTYKDLKANNVVAKKGGIIGLGASKALATDFNKDYFTRIDITKTKTIPIDSEEEIKLISEHTSDSYKLNVSEEKTVSLEILDASAFWKSSKYLVILIE